MIDLDTLSRDDVLAATPASLKEAFLQFEADKVPDDEVGQILAGSQRAGISLKGGGRFLGDLWTAAKNEFAEFVCMEGGKYASLREKFPKVTKDNQAMFIAQISAMIAATLGVQAGMIAPFVLWLLLVICRIGKEAFCSVARPSPGNLR